MERAPGDDLYMFARPRVAAHAFLACTSGKRAEAPYLDTATLYQPVLDFGEETGHGGLNNGERQFWVIGSDCSYEFRPSYAEPSVPNSFIPLDTPASLDADELGNCNDSRKRPSIATNYILTAGKQAIGYFLAQTYKDYKCNFKDFVLFKMLPRQYNCQHYCIDKLICLF